MNVVRSDIKKHKECAFRDPADSIISIKFKDGHIHHRHPADKVLAKQLVEDLINSMGLDLSKPETPMEQKPIIFRNRQAIGDILMFSCAVRDFKAAYPDWPINVQSTAMHIWDNNPYLDRSLNNNNAEVVEIGPSALTNASNRDDRHFANAYRISIQDKLGITFKQGAIKPDIWMTKEETATPIVEPPYWIIVAGEKGDWTAKTYPFDRWQNFVLRYPKMKFVQIGAKEHKHPKLEGDNVVNLIGKTQDRVTGIRDLFNLFYFAEGSMGLVSFQMHLAAAFGMPCVVIAGAREPARFTRYPGHQYLCTDGCLPCASTNACWHCDLEKTCPTIISDADQKYPKCVDIITLENLMSAYDQFYEGGRLSDDHPRTPTNPNPLTTKIEMPMTPAKTPPAVEGADPTKFDFQWGGACVTDLDWAFILKTIKDYKLRNCLEFGPGLSSFLMAEEGLKVISFETSEGWIKNLQEKDAEDFFLLNHWNGQVIPAELPKFDFALVDGPPGGKAREHSTKIASEHAELVIIHDAGREWERKWQDKYLKDKFDGPIKGGHRCHLWVKKTSKMKKEEPKLPIKAVADEFDDLEFYKKNVVSMSEGQKIFRMFCNTRGDGGCGRSIDFFMKAFINLGWRVEYVYTNPQPSGTHRRCGNPNVIATNNLELLRAPCDVFMLATDDYVWDLDKQEVVDMFSNVTAKRKVMYVNFKIGRIGIIPWTREFDQYLFLNNSLADSFTTNYMKAMGDSYYSIKPIILPPPADISEHLDSKIDYSGEMKIVRHSSQGNAKYAKDFNQKIEAILERFPKATIRLMPGPSFIDDFGERVIIHKRNNPVVKDFLKLGSVYWYDLPDGYTEGGPRVILEAMAVGLPCIATNSPGPQDRITKETGFLYDDFESSLEMFRQLNDLTIRERMGKAAKEYAIEKFNPQQWIDEIIGEK